MDHCTTRKEAACSRGSHSFPGLSYLWYNDFNNNQLYQSASQEIIFGHDSAELMPDPAGFYNSAVSFHDYDNFISQKCKWAS